MAAGVIRVCVVGAESTGTTTLVKALAEHYHTCWVPEVLRTYYECRMPGGVDGWRTDEFLFMARQQDAWEDAMGAVANRVLVCDTDSFALTLWHERYVGHMATEMEAHAARRRPHLYLLTDIDIPFTQDGTREGGLVRNQMHARFVQEMHRTARRYVLISGDNERRLATALAACDELLAAHQ